LSGWSRWRATPGLLTTRWWTPSTARRWRLLRYSAGWTPTRWPARLSRRWGRRCSTEPCKTGPASLVPANEPILRRVAEETFELGGILALVEPVKELCALLGGVSIAAPQIGKPGRWFVTMFHRRPVFINPTVEAVEQHGRTASPEGCLTWPGRSKFVSRWNVVRVSYIDEMMQRRVKEFRGVEARVMQHEVDHLNGICLFS